MCVISSKITQHASDAVEKILLFYCEYTDCNLPK